MRRSKREAARDSAEARRQHRAEWAVNRKVLETTREQKISEALQQDRGPRKVVEQILSSTHTPLLNRLNAQQRHNRAAEADPRFQELLRSTIRKAPRLLEENYVAALYFVAQLAWLRPLSEWHPKGKGRDSLFRSLAMHLLAKYPMPVLLWGAFFEDDAASLVPVVGVVTTGGSLFKEVQEGRFPVPLTRKMCHDLLTLSGEKFIEGIRTVQIRAHEGDKTLLRTWLATDVGAKIHTRQEENFWATVLLWFCQNPMLDRRQVAPLLDYISHRHANEPDFSMKGRSPLALIRARDEWHGELAKAKAITGTVFKPSGLKGGRYVFTGRDKLETTWKLEEILTAKQLAAEGNVLRHCVYSYARAIEDGHTSIWSLACDGEKAITVEVRQAQTISQARGKCNRPLTGVEYKILLRWAQDNCLRMDVGRL